MKKIVLSIVVILFALTLNAQTKVFKDSLYLNETFATLGQNGAKADTSAVPLLATPNTFTKSNTINGSLILPNIASYSSATEMVVLNGTKLAKDIIVDVNDATLEHVTSDSLTVNSVTTIGGANLPIVKQTLLNTGYYDLPTSHNGIVMITIGDLQEFIEISFTSAGVVTSLRNSANAVTTNTAGKLCAFDNGSNVRIVNNLGSTLILKVFGITSAN